MTTNDFHREMSERLRSSEMWQTMGRHWSTPHDSGTGMLSATKTQRSDDVSGVFRTDGVNPIRFRSCLTPQLRSPRARAVSIQPSMYANVRCYPVFLTKHNRGANLFSYEPALYGVGQALTPRGVGHLTSMALKRLSRWFYSLPVCRENLGSRFDELSLANSRWRKVECMAYSFSAAATVVMR